MPEKQGKGKRFFKSVIAVIGSVLLMGAVYLAAVLIQSPVDGLAGSFVVEDEEETVTRMQPAQIDDAQSLASLFGAPLPVVPSLLIRGQAGNTTHDGQDVRVATLQYEGLVVTAVRPASAAPLLLRGELSVSLKSDLTVLNHPAVLASRGGARCVYFSNESAAYSIYTPQADEEAFLEVLKRLTWAN
ncbi:MAG: hypothetical protein IKO52_10800 [Clostridia bacterium]|nr:hypothetical protein [Clostridia bacterium]